MRRSANPELGAGTRILGTEISAQEKSKAKREKVSALIRKNLDAILNGKYILANLCHDAEFPNQLSLYNFLRIHFMETKIKQIAQNILDNEKSPGGQT